MALEHIEPQYGKRLPSSIRRFMLVQPGRSQVMGPPGGSCRFTTFAGLVIGLRSTMLCVNLIVPKAAGFLHETAPTEIVVDFGLKGEGRRPMV